MKVTQRAAIAAVKANSVSHVVDVDDASQDPAGSSYKATETQRFNGRGLAVQNNLISAVAAPVVGSDSSLGYSKGSTWFFAGILYVCQDAAVGAAVWTAQGGAGTLEQVYTEGNTVGTSVLTMDSTNDVVGIGRQTLDSNTGIDVIGFGFRAALANSGSNVVGIGKLSARDNAGSEVVAMGTSSALGNAGEGVVGIGNSAANSNTGGEVVAIGTNAANSNVGNNVVALGNFAGASNLGIDVVAIGTNAAKDNEGANVVAAGNFSGSGNTGSSVIALGENAGLGNTLPNKTIIGNSELPTYANLAAAQAAITILLGGSAGSTYLFCDLSDDTIKFVRL